MIQKIFLFLALVAMLFSQAEPSNQFEQGATYEDHLCETNLIFDQWFRIFR